MKKKVKIVILALILLIVLLLGGIYIYLKNNPPLEQSMTAVTDNIQSVAIDLSNVGYGEIKIIDVKVNNNQFPEEVKIQYLKSEVGVELLNNSNEINEYNFYSLDEISIPKDTDIYQAEYGLNVVSKEPVETITIKYKYFGMNYEKTVSIGMK